MSDDGGDGDILVLNAGSSSIKFALFDAGLGPRLSGIAAGIGGQSFVRFGADQLDLPLIDHRAALTAVLAGLKERGMAMTDLQAAAHRVVHGGRKLTRPVRITPDAAITDPPRPSRPVPGIENDGKPSTAG